MLCYLGLCPVRSWESPTEFTDCLCKLSNDCRVEICRSELQNSCFDWYKQNFCSESAHSTLQMFSEISNGSQNFHGWKTPVSNSWIRPSFSRLHSAESISSDTGSRLPGMKPDGTKREVVLGPHSQGSGLKLCSWDISALLLGKIDSFDEVFVIFYSVCFFYQPSLLKTVSTLSHWWSDNCEFPQRKRQKRSFKNK